MTDISQDRLEARKEAVLEEHRYLTARNSDTSRLIGFGLLAVYFTIASTESEFAKNIADNHAFVLFVIGAMGLLTVALDYGQYLAGILAAEKARARTDNPYQYNKYWLHYKLRYVMFVCKQVTAAVGAAVLAVAMLITVGS